MASSYYPSISLFEHSDVSDSYAPDSYDRLSELPRNLILLILSLLCSTRDAVRTTILSKGWKDVWTTVPCLQFNDENPEFICGVLAQWRGAKLQRFHLYCSKSPPTSSDVESWLLFAVEKQVEELHVNLRSDHMPCYCPPQSLYSCPSITKLNLEYNCLLKIEGSVQLNQLETLSIRAPSSSWVEAINKILLGAPRLENMSLSSVDIRDRNFNITSRSLKTLIIRHAKIAGVHISAPNLLTLEIHVTLYPRASFSCDVPSLTEARFLEYYGMGSIPLETIRLWQSICHVKKLELSMSNIKLLLSLKKKKDMVVRFPDAEVLKHTSMRDYIDLLDVLHLLELFPKLKMLRFHRLNQGFKDFNPITAETAFPIYSLIHLKRVDMSWAAHDPSIIPFIGILLQNAPSLVEMVFRLEKRRDNHEVLLMVEEKVRSMPRSSPTAKVIILEDLID